MFVILFNLVKWKIVKIPLSSLIPKTRIKLFGFLNKLRQTLRLYSVREIDKTSLSIESEHLSTSLKNRCLTTSMMKNLKINEQISQVLYLDMAIMLNAKARHSDKQGTAFNLPSCHVTPSCTECKQSASVIIITHKTPPFKTHFVTAVRSSLQPSWRAPPVGGRLAPDFTRE